MKTAPPVAIAVGHFSEHHSRLVALGLLVTLLCGAAVAHHCAHAPSVQAITALACCCAGAYSWRMWPRQALAAGWLLWDGEHWQYESTHEPMVQVQLQVRWDGGHFVWVEVRPSAAHRTRRQHTCLLASRNSHQWHGVRCALQPSPSHTLAPQSRALLM